MRMKPTPSIFTFYRLETSAPIALSDTQREPQLDTKQLCQAVLKIHPVINHTLERSCALKRMMQEKETPPMLSFSDWVLVASNDFLAGKNMCVYVGVARRAT